METQQIKIDKSTITLFTNFYHNMSYAGELRIRLLDKVVFGGSHSILSLVMEKDMGKFGTNVNNSYYQFYLEFSHRVVDSRHPMIKTLYFKTFGELYEAALNEEIICAIINHGIDTNVFNTFSEEFFQSNIEINVADSEVKDICPTNSSLMSNEDGIKYTHNFTISSENTNNYNLASLDKNWNTNLKTDGMFFYK